MKIQAVDFIKSCVSPEGFPRDRLPEVAFVGRSNVGKSTLINSLMNRKKLAKVSRTPGKTRAINYFHVKTPGPLVKGFYLVDLPGYGYAKVSKSLRSEWEPLLEQYMTQRAELRGVLLLLDARGLQEHDHFTLNWLREIGRQVVLVLTKCDKLTRNDRHRRVDLVRKELGLSPESVIIPYSSITHDGRDELWRVVRNLVTPERT